MSSRFKSFEERTNDRRPLKEKLKEHYHNRDFTVDKSVANKFGVPYFLLCVFGQTTVCIQHVLPQLYEGNKLWICRMLCILIFLESFFNWFMCCRKYVNKVEQRSSDEQRADIQGWYYCAICQCAAPPRAHHCKVCKVCILRQSHHCFFAAGCIGFHTTANFVFLSFWLLISQLVAMFWLGSYLLLSLPGLSSFIPVVSFYNAITGIQTWTEAAIAPMFLLMFVNIFISGFYFFMESLSCLNNQTFYEGSKGIRKYNQRSRVANINATIGPYFWIRWLIPFPCAPTAGDGYEYNVVKSK